MASVYLGVKHANSFLVYLTAFMGSFYFAEVALSVFQVPFTLSLGNWFWVSMSVIVVFTAAGIVVQRKFKFHESGNEYLDNHKIQDDYIKQV